MTFSTAAASEPVFRKKSVYQDVMRGNGMFSNQRRFGHFKLQDYRPTEFVDKCCFTCPCNTSGPRWSAADSSGFVYGWISQMLPLTTVISVIRSSQTSASSRGGRTGGLSHSNKILMLSFLHIVWRGSPEREAFNSLLVFFFLPVMSNVKQKCVSET